MNFVYIGPLNDKSAVNGGYNFIGKNTVDIIQEYKRSNPSFNFECVDNTFKSKGLKRDSYDKSIFLAHPASFINKDGSVKNLFYQLLAPIKERYLHVFWETTPVPKTWLPLLKSDLFQGFVTSSKFVYTLLEQENLGKPIYLLPPMIKVDDYPKIDIDEKLKEPIFTCLFVGQRTIRKGFDDAIISFIRALGDKSDCAFLLKYHNLTNFKDFDTYLKNLVTTNFIGKFNASISSINSDLTNKQMDELYLKSSLLLFPSRGEGFGLPVVQCASMNLPIVSNGWSSLDEFKSIPSIHFTDYHVDCAVGMANHGYEVDSNYAIPSIADTIKKIREQYSLWKENRLDYYNQTIYNNIEIERLFGPEVALTSFDKFIKG